MRKTSQCDQILEHLKRDGPITAAVAMSEFGCYRLASRIHDLRERGHAIRTDTIETRNGAKIARYTLLQEGERLEDWVR